MRTFLDENFLLTTETAQELFHEHAKDQPICDYHNHLSAKDIARHRRFSDLTELWLETDHYKWRAMRACGVPEKFVTGNASAYEKFMAWARTVPQLVGSPLYHWTHLELQRYFGITEPLTPDNAADIWAQTKEAMLGAGFDAVSLLTKMNVKVLCTTDDPIDDLAWHEKIAQDATIPFQVLPSFRPDKYLTGADKDKNRAALCRKYDTPDIAEALSRALDFFVCHGCRVSDHGFGAFPYGEDADFTALMAHLGRLYSQKHIVMQLHLGPIRNTSPRLFSMIGADAGADSVGGITSPKALAAFLGGLEGENALPKTILYNLNPNDNTMLSTMAGSFAPQVQYGAAWWFNDHLRGIRAQLQDLMETNALASSVGMLTDSRSFTSFVRHEYYRRILCQCLGEQVEQGYYPKDMKTLGRMVENICAGNALHFFDFSK